MGLVLKYTNQLILQNNICRNTQLIQPLFYNTFEKGIFLKNDFHRSTSLHIKEFIPMVRKLKGKKKVCTAKLKHDMTIAELAAELKRPVVMIFEGLTRFCGTERITSSQDIVPIHVSAQLAKLAQIPFERVGNSVVKEKSITLEELRRPKKPTKEILVPRPPVVTIMGHVDHGKTTLLDFLRSSTIVDGEFGGITQHIGAFEVRLPTGQTVTFIDTPGHAAFKDMRARGAMYTDIIVLVVAADDGVMPQTIEVLELAESANVPLVIAINKIDKYKADLDKCCNSLLNVGIQVEDCGGDIQSIGISALKGLHIDKLLEAIVLQAEMLNINANPKGMVKAAILEAKKMAPSAEQPGGVSATVLVQSGTLKFGDYLAAGGVFCKVKKMYNDLGQIIKSVPPGCAAQIYGFTDSPSAGDLVYQYKDEKTAKTAIRIWANQEQKLKLVKDELKINKKRAIHHQNYCMQREENLAAGELSHKGSPVIEYQSEIGENSLSLVLKCDTDGSLETITNALATYDSTIVPMTIAYSGIGAITTKDLFFAKSSGAIVYTFNISTPSHIKEMAKADCIAIREHNIIYRLIETLKQDISKKMPLLDYDDIKGEAVVQYEFLINEGKLKRPVAGCRCIKGELNKKYLYKLVRGAVTILDKCEIDTLRNHKTEVSKIKEGLDCGLMFKNKEMRFNKDDKLYCYETKHKAQTTNWTPPGF